MFEFAIQASQADSFRLDAFEKAFQNDKIGVLVKNVSVEREAEVIRLFRIMAASADPKVELEKRITPIINRFKPAEDVGRDLIRCCDKVSAITKNDLKFLAKLYGLGGESSNVVTVFTSCYSMFLLHMPQNAAQAFKVCNLEWFLSTIKEGHERIGITNGNLLAVAEHEVKVQSLKENNLDQTLEACIGDQKAAGHVIEELAYLMTTRNYNDLSCFLPMLIQYAKQMGKLELSVTDMLRGLLEKGP